MSVHPYFHSPPVASFRVEATTLYHVVVGKEGAEPTKGLLVARGTKDGSRMKHRLACWRSHGAFAEWAQRWAMLGMLVLGLESVGLHAATYERKVELPPIALDATKLKEILDVTSEYLGRVNTSASNEAGVELTNESTGETTRAESLSLPRGRIPSPATYLNVTYRNYRGTISTIEITLSDVIRRITVKGESHLEVTNCAMLLEREILKGRVLYGGSAARTTLWFLLNVLIAISIWISFQISSLQATRAVLISGAAIILELMLTFLPWKDIYPGFSFHESHPSWFSRQEWLSVVGMLLTAALAVISLPPWFWKFVRPAFRTDGKVSNE